MWWLAACSRSACNVEDDGGTCFASTLPVVVIDTDGRALEDDERSADGSRVEVPVRLRVLPGPAALAEDGTPAQGQVPDFDGPAGAHVHGHTSAEEYPKLSFRIETQGPDRQDLDVGLLGLPADGDWVLYAPYSDKTLLRNHLLYGWSRAIGRYAARTVPVELFLLDDDRPLTRRHYRGVYLLAERIERGDARVDIASLEPGDAHEPAISGGYLLARDWREPGQPTFVTPLEGDVLQVRDPDPEDLTEAQEAWLAEWFRGFESALGDGTWDAWIDLDSFVDHMLLVELARNVDGYVLSTYMSKDREGPLAMGPVWDFESSLGNADYFGAWRTAGWHYENPSFPEDNPEGFRWYEHLLADARFLDRRAERWALLRAGPLADDALTADVRAAAEALGDAPDRNFDRWPVLGRYVWPNDDGARKRETFDEEVDYLADWVVARARWLDGAVSDR